VRGYITPAPSGRALAQIQQIEARAAAERATAGDLMLDVREAGEWASGHAPGAIHIPYPDLSRRMGEIPRDRPIVAYCASGVRSSLAASLLAADGREARNLRGGFAAWQRAGLDIVPG